MKLGKSVKKLGNSVGKLGNSVMKLESLIGKKAINFDLIIKLC
jgi:hypothetical protein